MKSTAVAGSAGWVEKQDLGQWERKVERSGGRNFWDIGVARMEGRKCCRRERENMVGSDVC